MKTLLPQSAQALAKLPRRGNPAKSGFQVLLAVAIALLISSAMPRGAQAQGTGDWTWTNGSSTIGTDCYPSYPCGQPGVYGTKGTMASANTPGSRYDATSWTDASGNKWLFGGFGYIAGPGLGEQNDLWEADSSGTAWEWVSGNNAPGHAGVYGGATPGTATTTTVPGGREGAASWVDKSGNLWLFGGWGYDGTGTSTGFGFENDLWMYNPTTNQWTWESGSSTVPPYTTDPQLGTTTFGSSPGVYGTLGTPAAGNTPGGRINAAAWTDSSGNLWLFGGGYSNNDGISNVATLFNDLWEFNTSTKQWTWEGGNDTANTAGVYGTLGTAASSNIPGARYQSGSWKDGSGNFWLFGGFGADSSGNQAGLDDLWEFNPTSNKWTFVSGAQTVATCGSFLFGYYACDQAGAYGTQGTAGGSNIPGGRTSPETWTDSSGNLWLFGGSGADAAGNEAWLNDLWEFNPTTPNSVTSTNGEWTWIGGNSTIPSTCTTSNCGWPGTYPTTVDTASPGNEPGARQQGAAWTDLSGNFWLFGGSGEDKNGTAAYLNDMWEFAPPSSGSSTPTAATPTFSVQPGIYTTAQTVAINDTTSGSTIYYTTNSTTPTTSSSSLSPGGTITVSSSETVEAIAVASGYTNSQVATANYTISSPAATPTFSIPTGTYSSAQTVTINDKTSGATIYYTTNGSSPVTSSSSLTPGGTITVSSSETVEAMAVATDYTNSAIASATYTITPVKTTPTVTVSPSPSSISTAQSLSVQISVSGSGSTPTGSVTLTSGSYTSASAALASGAATINVPAGSLATGTDTLTVSYTPDSSSSSTYNSATGTNSVTVTSPAKTTPTVTVSPSPTSITSTQSLTVTISVGGNPTPTGSVTLSSGSYSSTATTLASGSAMITVPAGSLATSTDTLTATYTPDAASSSTYNSATGSNTVTVTSPAKTTPTVTVSPSPTSITTAQSLTVTIGVGGNPTPTGSVTLSSGSYSSSATVLVSGSTMITIPAGSLATGSDTLTVTYTPDSASSSTYNSATGTNSVTVTAATVQVTVGTSPAGLALTVDGTSYASTQALTWTVGSSHSIATTSPQTNGGTQNTFASWSDGGAISHSVTAPSTATSYTATFATAYQLTTSVNPSAGGTVTPPSGAYYATGTVVNLTATPTSGYSFTNWSGTVASTGSVSTTVTMNAAQSVTANFSTVVVPAPIASLTPPSLSFTSVTGSATAAQVATLSNTGNATLTITGITIAGSNPTDFTVTTGSNACGSSLTAGASCSIYVTFTPASATSFGATLTVADNASGSPQTTTLSGVGTSPTVPSFVISSTTTPQTVQPGGTATYSITASAQNGTFPNSVTLAASGLPAGATATFLPTSITPGSSSATSTLTIQTAKQVADLTTRKSQWPLAAPALALIGFFFLPGKRSRRWITLTILLLASLGTFTALTACGGGFSMSSASPATNYTVTITGTSGTVQQTTTVQLTVQ